MGSFDIVSPLHVLAGDSSADDHEEVPDDVPEAIDESDAASGDNIPDDIPEAPDEIDITAPDTAFVGGSTAPSDRPSEVKPAEDTPIMKDCVKEREGIEASRAKALEKLSQTSEGQKFLEALGGSEKFEQLIAADDGDPLTRAATLAQQAGLDAAATGRIVHRAAEMRTMKLHPDEIVDGTRMAEQRIDYVDEDGQEHHIEIDDVIVRGDKHYIRDYKPLNLQAFEETDAGRRWAEWMEANVGGDFRQRIQAGSNPYDTGTSEQPMPREIRAGLQDFLRTATEQHKQQLDSYRELYAKARNIDGGQVHTAVRPYFVYR